jgi:hypothetical protein
MLGLLAAIIPLGLAGAVVPTRIMVGLLLLSTSQKPLRNTLAYLAGLICLHLAVGFLALYWIGSTQAGHHTPGSRGAIVLATLQVMGGAIFILIGLKTLVGSDPDAPSPAWTQRLPAISAGAAFALGLLLALGLKLLMILVAAATVILEAHLGFASRIFALLILIALMLLGEIIPIALYARNPVAAHVWLNQLVEWLKTHNRTITVVLSLGLGAAFLIKGLGVLRTP